MKDDRTGMYGTLCASYKTATTITGKGSDIFYRVTVFGNQPLTNHTVHKGYLVCHASFENTLPETLENVKVASEVSSKEIMNPTDLSNVFHSDRLRFPKFLTGYELFMLNQFGNVKDRDAKNNKNSDTGVSKGLTGDVSYSTIPPSYYSLKKQLTFPNVVLWSTKLMTESRSKSEQLSLFQWMVTTHVLHMFDLKPLNGSRAEEISDIYLYI